MIHGALGNGNSQEDKSITFYTLYQANTHS